MADKQLYIVGPDGQLGTIPASSQGEALSLGYRLADTSEVKDAKTRERANTPGGIITTFLTNAGNEFALGAPGAAVDVAAAHGVQSAQEIKRVGDTYAEENPIAATLGKVFGFGAQVLGSGGTSLLAKAGLRGVEAATKAGAVGLAERVAGEVGKRAVTRAAEGAAQGVAISAAASAAPAITEAIVGDPQEAAQRFVHSVGIGALLGGTIAPTLGGVGDTVKGVVGRASGKLSDTAYRLAAETAGLTPTQVRNLERFHGFSVKDIGKYLIDNGIVEIGDSGAASLTKLGERMEKVGSSIGEIIQQTDDVLQTERPGVNGLLERIHSKIDNYSGEAITVEQREQMKRTVRSYLESDMLGKVREPGLSRSLRESIDDKAQRAAVLDDNLSQVGSARQAAQRDIGLEVNKINKELVDVDSQIARMNGGASTYGMSGTQVDALAKLEKQRAVLQSRLTEAEKKAEAQLSKFTAAEGKLSGELQAQGSTAQPLFKQLEEALQDPQLAPAKLAEFKTRLQRTITNSFEKTTLPPQKRALMILRDEISAELEHLVAVAEGKGGPKLADYLGLKRDFELGVNLQEGFEKQAARELSPSGSLLEKLKSSPTAVVGSLVGGAAGLLSGQALLALPAAALGAVVSNYLRRRSTSTLATILDKAAAFEITVPKFGGLTAPVAAEASMVINAKTYPEFSRAMGALQAQPHLIGQRLPDSGNTDVQMALSDTIVRAHSFLYEKMPKNPNPNPLDPEADYRPSDAEIAKFNRYYQAVYDPRSAIERLTPEGIEALKTVYPSLYNELVQNVAEHFAKKRQKGEKTTHVERLHLSKFFDMPEIKALPLLQNTFNTQPQTSGGGTPKLSITGAREMSLDEMASSPTRRSEAR